MRSGEMIGAAAAGISSGAGVVTDGATLYCHPPPSETTMLTAAATATVLKR